MTSSRELRGAADGASADGGEAEEAEEAEAEEAEAEEAEAEEELSGRWRSACLQSEGMVRGYARAAAAEAQPLPLPAMTDVCLAGGRGVSEP